MLDFLKSLVAKNILISVREKSRAEKPASKH